MTTPTPAALRAADSEKFIVSICPETGRAFICLEGKDDNVAEVFHHGAIDAHDRAFRMVKVLNNVKKTSSMRRVIERLASELNSRIGDVQPTKEEAAALDEARAILAKHSA